jgi:alkaline phosphatase
MMEEHTGAAVPLYANSQGQGKIPAFVQQSEIFKIMMDYLGL